MLKAPTSYNPKRNPERSIGRRNRVFEQMGKYEYLDTILIDSLQELPIDIDYKYLTKSSGLAPHFREMLRLEVEKVCGLLRNEDGDNYDVYKDGLKIYTTIDSKMQKYAESAVQTHMKDLQKTFFDHWKGRMPWGKEDKSVRSAMKKTNRYKRLKEKGWKEEAIEKHFKTPTEIGIYTYDSIMTKQISPWDSIVYYHYFLNTGFLAMNPKNGFVNAYVGSVNHQYFQYDHVFAKRQVGSTFKPIVYAEALENGHLPCDFLPNEKYTYEAYQNWTPGNSDGKYGGYYSIKGGLTNSVNTVAVQLMMENGVSSVQELARKMGIHSELPNVPSIALGTADISLYEMLQVYATFANRGKPIEPIYLLKIEDKRGKVLKEFEKPMMKENVISEKNADYMVKMLESVVDSGTARRLRFRYGLTGSIGGKTGTTQNQTDGWFMGITPNLVAGVWVGGRDRSVRFRSTALGQGANMALPIWGLFMKSVYADKSFNLIKQAYFPALPDSLSIDCPQYVDYLTEIDFGDENLEYLEEEELIDLLDLEDKNPIELSEDDVERLEEIKKKQEKRKEKEAKMTEREIKREKRKEKSRKFFDKVKKLIKKD
jgi:penicillin-binding protein 1A